MLWPTGALRSSVSTPPKKGCGLVTNDEKSSISELVMLDGCIEHGVLSTFLCQAHVVGGQACSLLCLM